MKLKNLRLINFKNHLDSQWEFNNSINCFVGDNGSGKTNILDAIHYLSLTKSYFNSNDSTSINFNSEFFTVKGLFEKQNNFSNIICNVKEGIPKSLKNNDKKYKRFSDHIGGYPVVFISPTDTNLIYESSDTRRRYIDSGISQFNNVYLKNLISYNKTLKQRNGLLKQFAISNTFDSFTLSTYNEILVKYGECIYLERKEYLQKLIPVFQKYYSDISGGKEQVNIEYQSQLGLGKYLPFLESTIIKDRSSTRTSVGVHKDDLVFTLDGHSIKKHGSQGQQKSFLISLKLAQFEFMKEQLNLNPILLLDDVFDKLDDKRVECLVSFVKKGKFNQVFITDTNKERSENILKKTDSDYTIFKIER